MWNTNSIFFPCPKNFRFWSFNNLEGNIVEVLDSSFHPCRVGSQLSREIPSSCFAFCYDLIDSIISFLVIWILYFCMTYTWSCWIDVKSMPILWYPFRWYEMRQSLRLFLYSYICTYNKSRRLCNFPIWRVYVYSIWIYTICM